MPTVASTLGGVLDTVSSASRSQGFTLDSVGNQTSVTTNSTAVTRTVNSQNQLTGNGSATLTYDNNGNTTTDQTGKQYVPNAWNQIVTVKNSSGTTIETFAVDAFGRRIVESPGTANDLYYSNLGQVLEQRQGSTVVSQNIWGLDYVNDLVLRDDNSTTGNLGIAGSGLGERLYAQHNVTFNVTALTNSSGAVVQRFQYDSYGSVTVLSPSWGSSTTDAYNWRYTFQGVRFDPVTGLYHTPNRDLSPGTGRWMQQDGGYWDGSNLYQAFGSGPSSRVDPTGLGTVHVPFGDTPNPLPPSGNPVFGPLPIGGPPSGGIWSTPPQGTYVSDSGFGPSQPGPVGPPDFSVSEAGWFRNFAFGFTAQWAIWDTYIPLHGGYENVYHDNRALKGIAEDLGGCWKAPKAILSPLWKLVARMRPDIYEISTGALYEIKPAGSEALARDTAVLEVLMLMGAGVPQRILAPRTLRE